MRSGIYSSQELTILSSLPDHLVEHVSGLGHLGGLENQVDVVVLKGDHRLKRGASLTLDVVTVIKAGHKVFG